MTAVRRVEKPWGHEEILVETEHYRLKILVIRAGHETSVQYHARKHESVYVDGGTLDLLLGAERSVLHRGESAVIGPGRVHQFRATDGLGARLIEVSNAVGDDDVFRVSDRYGRAP